MSPLLAMPTPSGQAGEIGMYIAEENMVAQRHLRESCIAELRIDSAINQLIEILKKCSEENWDGDGADPVPGNLIFDAISLIENMPNGVNDPEITPEPDGALCFEWFSAPNKVLTMELTADGNMHYAVLNKNKRIINVKTIEKNFPEEVIQNINEIMDSNA